MMRSLFSGVAGLKVHQTKMDVIGNNVANVNTTAYKSQSITFSELMYQTTSNASGPNAVTGTAGINAKQIGLGVTTGAISTAITTAGSAQTTSNPFDIRISGDNFFVVSDGMENYFTRDGSFYVDAAGNLAMTSNGYNVMGWQVDETTGKIKQDTVSALRVMSQENMTYDPEFTTKGYISGIVDKNDPTISSTSGKIVNLSFYDNLGYSYTAKLSMHSTANDGEFYLVLDDILDANGDSITEYYGVDLDQIVTLGAATTVDINESYNPITNTFSYTDTTQTPAVTDSYTMSSTFEQASGYSFCFKDSSGTVVTDQGLIDALAASQNLDLSKLNSTATAGVYATTPTDVESWLTDNAAVVANIGALKALFGDGITTSMNAGTVDALTGTITITNKSIEGGLIKYNTDTGKFISANGNDKGLTLEFKDNFSVTDANGATTVTSLGNFADITIDMTTSKSSNNGGACTITADAGGVGTEKGLGTGRKLGELSGISISENGEIYASYDNGMSRLLGQIASAEFSNASGLEKVGDNLYQTTMNSGDFDGIGVDITTSGGAMKTGQLEMSNVDLAQEFTDMITTQRGYQANSKVITTSDSLLEVLVNLKR